MDLDAYVSINSAAWARLEELLGKRRLSGEEADELVARYQQTATHLSVIRTRSPDPVLVARLSGLVARGRTAVVGTPAPAWRAVLEFFTVVFPVSVLRAWRWWCAVGTGSSLVAFGLMGWLAVNPEARTRILAPSEAKALCKSDFASYYSDGAAGSFALSVWTNNAFVTAGALVAGIFILPTLYLLLQNVANAGVIGGEMIGCGNAAQFWGLITPHGILELTAVFVGAGAGLQIGWAWIAPGRMPRSRAIAERARAAITVALGLVVVLAVSGVIEAFVTPSGLPTYARVGIGVLAELGFLGYVLYFGLRAKRAGETGDLGLGLREDTVAVS